MSRKDQRRPLTVCHSFSSFPRRGKKRHFLIRDNPKRGYTTCLIPTKSFFVRQVIVTLLASSQAKHEQGIPHYAIILHDEWDKRSLIPAIFIFPPFVFNLFHKILGNNIVFAL